jgi:chemotaxis protein MotB
MALEEDRPPELPDWMVTYGDMMSLLLTFFVMIASFSEVREQEKYEAVATSMHRQFGHDVASGAVVPGWTRPRNGVMANMTTRGRTQKHELVRGRKEPPAVGEVSSQNILRTKEFLEQELGIPAERIRISVVAGDEAKVEISLQRTEDRVLSTEY